MTLKIIHLELADANSLVSELHRHHKPVVGHRFSVGVIQGPFLVGAAIVGRPVARAVDQRNTIEVTRLVTDGTKNACSILYAACARAGRELGYTKIQTYILETEPGTSLRAAGWEKEADTAGGSWDTPSRPRQSAFPLMGKQRWAKKLSLWL